MRLTKWAKLEGVAREEETYRHLISKVCKRLSLPQLRALLRAVRYAEEGREFIVVYRQRRGRQATKRTLGRNEVERP